ncbi:GNAT family N-acetyltransferase [Arthrobacter agilis]|uniref:GNAT family N-acetyltransferase n=1 Tax=Arthrobacter agilis TaxID=37921 RepID=UPI00278A4AB8|nr:GNAT family N-acetyltransferase [Arthrobacter agilis]MDQ0734673.1 ribosomal protein S18 acetylase RimI-like enzyme [Arthrobacter agilis]
MQEHGVVIQRGTGADAVGITSVHLRSRRQALPYLPVLHSDEETLRWITDVVLETHEVWVVRRNTSILAFMALNDDVLEQLYVDPAHLGQGIGSRLVCLAQERRPKGLQLYTFVRNTRARTFYEHHGFSLVRTGDGSGNEEKEPDALYRWAPEGPDTSSRDPAS